MPLISQNACLVQLNEEGKGFQSLKKQLETIRYDSAKLHLKTVEELANGKWLLDIKIEPDANGQLPEIKNMEISFLLDDPSVNELHYQLMDEFLSLSDRHVDENFHYKGFARFSRKNSIIAIAELSSVLRQKSQGEEDHAFAQAYESANYETDKSRVPKLYQGLLSDKIKSTITRFGQLEGILPD